jgi:hypothetical protein
MEKLHHTKGVSLATASVTGDRTFPWRRNWIDWRESRANVHRRIDRGQIPPTCIGCGCETDRNPTPHSPRCEAPA